MTGQGELTLYFNRSYRITHTLIPVAVLGVSAILLGFAAATERSDLAAVYRWTAAAVAAVVVVWAIVVVRALRRPALGATECGLDFGEGHVLDWELCTKAMLVTIEGEEWLGFRLASGVHRTLAPEIREALRNQPGWCLAKLAGAVPTRSLAMERDEVVARLTALSGLPLAGRGAEAWHTRRRWSARRPPRSGRLARFLGFGRGRGERLGIGQALAALIVLGFFATAFAGSIALVAAVGVAVAVLLVWLLVRAARELRAPLARRAWGAVAAVAVETLLALLLTAAVLAVLLQQLPGLLAGR